MAKAIGISLGSVQCIWRAHKLQPNRRGPARPPTHEQQAARRHRPFAALTALDGTVTGSCIVEKKVSTALTRQRHCRVLPLDR
jgi:hypothetical protein